MCIELFVFLYFVHEKVGKKILAVSKAGFSHEYLQDVVVRDNPVAKQGLFQADCILEMKQNRYKTLLVLKYDSTIDQAS